MSFVKLAVPGLGKVGKLAANPPHDSAMTFPVVRFK
jgi:hypothetical protein